MDDDDLASYVRHVSTHSGGCKKISADQPHGFFDEESTGFVGLKRSG
jgi:hypothetical protein